MSNYHLKTGGSATAPYDTWAKSEISALTQALTSADTVWASQAHAETQAGAWTLTAPTTPGAKLIGVNDGADPPTALATGASITTTGNVALSINGCIEIDGIQFIAGSGSSGAICTVGLGTSTATSAIVINNSKLENRSTAATASFLTLGGAAASSLKDCFIDIRNTSIRSGHTGQSVVMGHARIRLNELTFDALSSIPTTFLKPIAGAACDCIIVNSDLSGKAFTNLVNVGISATGRLILINCKLPAGVAITTGTFPNPGGLVVELFNCDSGNTRYRYAMWCYEGSVIDEHTIVKTGGSTDGTTAGSLKMVSSPNVSFMRPLRSPAIAMKPSGLGSALNATLDFEHDSVTALKDTEFWGEGDVLDASNTLGNLVTDRAADLFSAGADQDTSSATWTTTGQANPNAQQAVIAITPQQDNYVMLRGALAKPSYTVFLDYSPTGLNTSPKQNMVPGFGYVCEPPASGGGVTYIPGLIGG